MYEIALQLPASSLLIVVLSLLTLTRAIGPRMLQVRLIDASEQFAELAAEQHPKSKAASKVQVCGTPVLFGV